MSKGLIGVRYHPGKPLTSSMDNVLAWRLGEACRKAADNPRCGDYIDRGLILLSELREAGFDVLVREDDAP